MNLLSFAEKSHSSVFCLRLILESNLRQKNQFAIEKSDLIGVLAVILWPDFQISASDLVPLPVWHLNVLTDQEIENILKLQKDFNARIIELVSKELNHFGVIADLFR